MYVIYFTILTSAMMTVAAPTPGSFFGHQVELGSASARFQKR
jgi:hypothetical protein